MRDLISLITTKQSNCISCDHLRTNFCQNLNNLTQILVGQFRKLLKIILVLQYIINITLKSYFSKNVQEKKKKKYVTFFSCCVRINGRNKGDPFRMVEVPSRCMRVCEDPLLQCLWSHSCAPDWCSGQPEQLLLGVRQAGQLRFNPVLGDQTLIRSEI